jgi:hypothetical protein
VTLAMRKHASLDELALLDADALKPRKAAKVRSHLAECSECSQHHAALGAVPSMLASTSTRYEPMPDNLSSRLDSVLAAESARREASQPGTEASRGLLPERSRRSGIFAGAGQGWRMPRLSGPTVRALATAGAVAVVVGGGIGIASQFGGVSSSSSPASGGAHAAVRGAANGAAGASRMLHKGLSVRYGHGSTAYRIQEVTAGTNFTRATLTTQVKAAITAEKQSGLYPYSKSLSGLEETPPAPANSLASFSATAGGTAGTPAALAPSAGQLAGCLNVVVPGQKVQLLEHAKFEGTSATIIVTAVATGHPAQVWVVGDSCSATNRDVLLHGTVPND